MSDEKSSVEKANEALNRLEVFFTDGGSLDDPSSEIETIRAGLKDQPNPTS